MTATLCIGPNDQRARSLFRLIRTVDVPVEDVQIGDILLVDDVVWRVAAIRTVSAGPMFFDSFENGAGFWAGSKVKIIDRGCLAPDV